MDALTFDATRFVRPALRSIVFCFSIIVISSMTLAKPAQASGTVTPTTNTYFVWGNGFGNYVIAASPAAACGPSGSQTTGPVITQVSASRWQCTFTYRSDVGLPPSYWGTHWTSYADYVSSTCPAHTTTTNPPCICKDPYMADSAGTSCILSACPANMSGSPCVCNAGFVPNSSGSCDAEVLTITLSGGSSTEPWNAMETHDPDHMKANLPFVAIVKNQNGQPKAGVNVYISSNVTSGTGGHNHNNGRPKGKLVDTHGTAVSTISTVDGGATLSGVTDSSGIFWFTFGAEEASGEHTVTATCDGCSNNPQTATVNVAITGLMRLDDDRICTTYFDLRGGLAPHLDNHYFTGAAMAQVVKLAIAFNKKYGELLKVNDSSLIKGGLYDIGRDWMPSHAGHRKGIVVDINNYQVQSRRFESFAADLQIDARWEGLDVTLTPHYHLRLLWRDE